MMQAAIKPGPIPLEKLLDKKKKGREKVTDGLVIYQEALIL